MRNISFLYLKQYKSRAREEKGEKDGSLYPRLVSAIQVCIVSPLPLHPPSLPPQPPPWQPCRSCLWQRDVCVYRCWTHTQAHTEFIYRAMHTPKVVVPLRGFRPPSIIWLWFLPYLGDSIYSPAPFSSGSLICYVSAKINSTLISEGFGVYCWGKKKGYLLAVTRDMMVCMH